MKRHLLLILCSASLFAADTVIRNATVITVTKGTIPNGAVLVRDGKIAAVGTNGSIQTSPGARVIDASGKFLFPGIIDAHSHTAIEGGVNETSLVNTGMVRVSDVLVADDISAYRQLAGGTTAANILHGSSNSIGGQNAVVKWKWGRPIGEWLIEDAPRGIKFALGENPKSSNWRLADGATRPYPNTRMGVEEVIRGSFVAARDYRTEWENYEARRKRGEDVIAPRKDLLHETMLGILDGDILVHSHAYRSDEMLMLMRVAEEMGFRVRTFQHVLEGYKIGREMARHGAGGSTFTDWWGFKAEAYDAIPHNSALMTRSGVVVSVNSDSDELARRLNLEAAKTMKYGGLTEDEALRTCTINPAMHLGIGHRVGSIEVGKDADLVIWNAHPLSNYARVETTMIEGEIVFDRAADLAARDRIARDRAALLEREKKLREKPKAAAGGKGKETTR
jgi:imidazolonepropionase-like amidohydrolase